MWLQPALFGTNCQLLGGEWNSALGSGNITVEWDPILCVRLCDHPFPNKRARASWGARTWPEHCWCGLNLHFLLSFRLFRSFQVLHFPLIWLQVERLLVLSFGLILNPPWWLSGLWLSIRRIFVFQLFSHHLSCWIRSSSATLFGSILLSSWFAAHRSGLDSTGSASSCLPRWSCSASCSPRFVWQASDLPWLQQAHQELCVQPVSRWFFLHQRFSNISRQADPRWFTGGG